jgi:hypothetical protein
MGKRFLDCASNSVCPSAEPVRLGHRRDAFFPRFARVRVASNEVFGVPEEEIWFPHLGVWGSAV